MLECTFFEDLRKVCLPRDLFTRPNTVKFEHLMSSSNTDTQLLFNIAKFCKNSRKFSGIFDSVYTKVSFMPFIGNGRVLWWWRNLTTLKVLGFRICLSW